MLRRICLSSYGTVENVMRSRFNIKTPKSSVTHGFQKFNKNSLTFSTASKSQLLLDQPNKHLFVQINNRNPRTRCEQFNNKNTRKTSPVPEVFFNKTTGDVVLASFMLTLNIFHTFNYCFYC